MKKQFVILAASVALAQFSGAALAQQGTSAAWAGWARCQINVQGPGYTDQQTHTWTISGGAPTTQGAFQVYAATWSVVGGGSFSRTQGNQTLTAQWATNAPSISAPLAVFVRASDHRMFIQSRHAQLRSTGAVQGYQQVTIAGKPQTPGKIGAEAFEWGFPVIAVSAPVPPDTHATAVGSNTSSTNGSVGMMQPAGSQGTASCTWQFGQGSAAPAPPPPLTAQAVPTPGNPATTSPPPNNSPPTSSPPTPTNSPSARLVSISPSTVEQGAIGTIVTLTGQGTHWSQTQPVITVSPGFGAPRIDAQATSDTELLSSFDVQYTAAPGPRTITVTTGAEVVTLPNALTVTARARPELVSVTPNRAKQGEQNVTVQLTGKNTRWVQGATRVRIAQPVDASQTGTPEEKPGVTVLSTTVHSPTSASAVLNVDANAVVGSYWFSVFDAAPSDWLKIVDGFTVEAAATSAPILTAVPIEPALIPLPRLCNLRAPALKPSYNYVTPGTVHLYWEAVGGATGYTLSRADRGVLTKAPLPASYTEFTDYAPLPHPATYVYTLTAEYPQGCGSTNVTLSSQPPITPFLGYQAGSAPGQITLSWSWYNTSDGLRAGDYTGVLITGPALPSAGREVKRASQSGGTSTLISGVPPGSHSFTAKAYWDTPGGRIIDNTGRTITVRVP